MFLLVFTMMGLISGLIGTKSSNGSETLGNPGALSPKGSIDPASPDFLADEVDELESFDTEDEEYYYDTFQVNASGYFLSWVYTAQPGVVMADNLNLYLYSDSNYTVLVDSSTSMTDYVDWVVYRPASSQSMYPMVYTEWIWGTCTNNRIEAQSGVPINLSSTYDVFMSLGECGDLFVVALSSSTTYNVDLDVPAGCDFDLYAFRLAPGSSSQVDYEKSEEAAGSDEHVTLQPTSTDDYAIVVIFRSGSGTAKLTVAPRTGIPSFEMLPVLIALISLMVIYITKKHNLIKG